MKSLAQAILCLAPKPVHRALLRLARSLTQLWRRFHYRPAEGCAVIVQNGQGHILLVRHTYVEPQTWMLPAGRMNPPERPLAAAQRELTEEMNCGLIAAGAARRAAVDIVRPFHDWRELGPEADKRPVAG